MTEVWRVVWRDQQRNGHETSRDHDTEAEAFAWADHLAAQGQTSVVYPIGGIE